MAQKPTGLEVLERTAAIPRPLAFDGEHHPLGVAAHAARTTQTAANRNHLAGRRDLHGPPAKQVVGFVGTAQAQRDPDVPLGVVLRSEGELMPLGIAPIVAQGVIPVGDPIPVSVGDAGHISPTRGGHGPILPRQRKDLILPAGEELVFGPRRRIEGASDEIDIATAGTHGEASIGQHFQPSWMQRNPGGNGDVDDGIIFSLFLCGAPHRAEVFLGPKDRHSRPHGDRPQQARLRQRSPHRNQHRRRTRCSSKTRLRFQRRSYHWYSRVRVDRPGGGFRGMSTSSDAPPRTLPE